MLILFILLIVGIYFLGKRSGSGCMHGDNSYVAEVILKKRYINGEIDDETYLRMLKLIRSN
jgi:uncharacterized membrane protein